MSSTLITSTSQEATSDIESTRNATGLFAILSAVLLTSFLMPMPAANGQIAHVPAFCPFYLATGLPCPGCGLTRAFVCISHGHFVESLHWHPIGLLVYLSFVWLWVYYGLFAIRRQRPYVVPPKIKSLLGYAAVITVLGTGLIRMAWVVATHHNPF